LNSIVFSSLIDQLPRQSSTPSSIIGSEGTEMRIASAVVFSVLAQIHTTTPPSQPTLPSPQERAMEQIHLETQAREGDVHYQRRAEGRQADVASSIEIDGSLEAYAAALRKDRADVDDRWKYLRSTYFKAEYTGQSDDQKAALVAARIRPYRFTHSGRRSKQRRCELKRLALRNS